jgi:hypothetical protein
MESKYVKAVSIRLPVILWRLVKVHCLQTDQSVKQFILEAVSAKLREAENQKI